MGDIIQQVLEIKNKADIPLKFHVRVEFEDGEETPNPEATTQINALLEEWKKGFGLQ